MTTIHYYFIIAHPSDHLSPNFIHPLSYDSTSCIYLPATWLLYCSVYSGSFLRNVGLPQGFVLEPQIHLRSICFTNNVFSWGWRWGPLNAWEPRICGSRGALNLALVLLVDFRYLFWLRQTLNFVHFQLEKQGHISLGANLTLTNLKELFESMDDPSLPYSKDFARHLQYVTSTSVRNVSRFIQYSSLPNHCHGLIKIRTYFFFCLCSHNVEYTAKSVAVLNHPVV